MTSYYYWKKAYHLKLFGGAKGVGADGDGVLKAGVQHTQLFSKWFLFSASL